MQKAVATYLVDPNKLFREGLKKLLTETRFEIVGESADASNLTDGRNGTQPALILIDTPTGPENLNRDVAQLRAAMPEARLVVLTPDYEPRKAFGCILGRRRRLLD